MQSEFLPWGYERDMQRNPRIINLRDKPLYPRHAPARHSEASNLGTRLLSCAAITLATAGFFWAYDAIAHRDSPSVPSFTRVATSERHPVRTVETLIPDMNAPEILRANADVPPSARQKTHAAETEHSSAVPQATTPPKKKTHVVRRVSPEAQQAYASAPAFGSAPSGSW
jgi:hypothetical protein